MCVSRDRHSALPAMPSYNTDTSAKFVIPLNEPLPHSVAAEELSIAARVAKNMLV